MSANRGPILVLDAFGVIYRPGDDVQGLLIPFIADQGGTRDQQRIESLYREASLGKIDARQFWSAVGLDPRLEDEYLSHHEMVDGVHEFLLAANKAFSAIACLSNDVSAWSRKLRERHRLATAIPNWMVSGDLGLRKPAPEIYARMLQMLGVAGDRIVFVDDRVSNLDAARAFGIHTVWMRPAGAAETAHAVARSLRDVLPLADRAH